MIIPELPNYITSLGAPDKKGLIISAFAFAALIARPLSGKLTDTIGRIPIMVIGVIVCIVVGVMYPIFNSVCLFIFLRFIHGFSSGFKPTATTSYMADLVPLDKRGKAMGILGISGSIGMSSGPYLGSWIAQNYGLDYMFYASSMVAILSIIVLAGMKETLEKPVKFKFSMLKIGVDDLFDKQVIPAGIVMFLTVFSFGAILTIIPDFTDHLKLENRGIFFAYFLGASIFTRMFAGGASDKFGRVATLRIGTLLLIISMILLSFVSTEIEFYVVAVITGVSAGINSPTVFAWNIDLANKDRLGKGMSTLFIMLELGIIFGSLLGAKVYNNAASNFKYTFWLCAFMAFIAFGYLFFIKKDKIHTFKTLN